MRNLKNLKKTKNKLQGLEHMNIQDTYKENLVWITKSLYKKHRTYISDSPEIRNLFQKYLGAISEEYEELKYIQSI